MLRKAKTERASFPSARNCQLWNKCSTSRDDGLKFKTKELGSSVAVFCLSGYILNQEPMGCQPQGIDFQMPRAHFSKVLTNRQWLNSHENHQICYILKDKKLGKHSRRKSCYNQNPFFFLRQMWTDSCIRQKSTAQPCRGWNTGLPIAGRTL